MADIIVKDRFGNDVNHVGPSGIRVRTADGSTKVFVDEDLVESSGSIPEGVATVNFYDYDGTLVAEYTVEQANALTELPAAPVHEGLVFQEWNYTLAEVNAATGSMDVGATYITDDGITRLYLGDTTSCTLNFTQSIPNGVTVNWGDGNVETSESTGSVNIAHTYAERGDYCIELTVVEGCEAALGGGTLATSIVTSVNILLKAHIGTGFAQISDYGFYGKYSLAEIAIPNSVTKIGDCAFQNAYKLRCAIFPRWVNCTMRWVFYGAESLKTVSLPEGDIGFNVSTFCGAYLLKRLIFPKTTNVSVSSLGGDDLFYGCFSLQEVKLPPSLPGSALRSNMFYNCYNLRSITIPAGVTKIEPYALSGCKSLSKLIVPDGVTDIGTYAFHDAYGIDTIVLPASLTSVGKSFMQNGTTTRIYVPDNMVDTFKAMTNLTSYATHIFPVSELDT